MNAFRSASNQLTPASSKGCVFEETLPLLRAVGIETTEDPETLCKLTLPTSGPALCMIIVRASDAPTYVQYGTADLGVVGRDVLVEHGMADLCAPINLNIAHCRMSVAMPKGFDYANAVHQDARLSVVTKYLNTAREHFAKKDVHVDPIKLHDSAELGPLVGLADAAVDLISTGGTLHANNLVGVEGIVRISSRLAVNQVTLKLKCDRPTLILDTFECAPAIDAYAGEAV